MQVRNRTFRMALPPPKAQKVPLCVFGMNAGRVTVKVDGKKGSLCVKPIVGQESNH